MQLDCICRYNMSMNTCDRMKVHADNDDDELQLGRNCMYVMSKVYSLEYRCSVLEFEVLL